MIYFQGNLIHIRTYSDQLPSKKTPSHTEVPNTFLDGGDSPCIYDIAEMIRKITENNFKHLLQIVWVLKHSLMSLEFVLQRVEQTTIKILIINCAAFKIRIESFDPERQAKANPRADLWNKIHKSGFSIFEINRQYKLASSTLYKIQK